MEAIVCSLLVHIFVIVLEHYLHGGLDHNKGRVIQKAKKVKNFGAKSNFGLERLAELVFSSFIHQYYVQC